MFEHCRNRPGTISSRRSLGSAAYDAGTNALIFPAHLLDARMPTPEPERFWSAVGQALAASAEVRRGEPLPSATRREILARLGSFRVDQTMVAGALGLSRRSLRRRLAAAHTGFSELLADCRLQLARLRLLHSRMPLAAIADELGYSDKTAFERAFRRSTGATPSRYRAQMQFPTAGSGRVASPPSL
jgi:AraC-like DNA-binding protein